MNVCNSMAIGNDIFLVHMDESPQATCKCLQRQRRLHVRLQAKLDVSIPHLQGRTEKQTRCQLLLQLGL